jgi:putative heme transporter
MSGDGTGQQAATATVRPGRERRLRLMHSIVIALVVALLATEAVIVARHFGAVGTALARAHPTGVLLALAAEIVSWVAYAALHRRLLRGGGLRVALGRVAGVLLAGNAISTTLPAGAAVASAYTFTRWRRFGASVPLAAWAIVISGLLSGATLTALGLGAALVVGVGSTNMVTAIVAVALTLAVAIAFRAGALHPQLLMRAGRALVRLTNRIRRRDRSTGLEHVEEFVNQIVVIRPRASDWLAATGFAAVNWAADLACLVLAAHAVGITDLTARTVLVAYAADAAVGLIQLVPGGVGIVDGAIVLALVGGGVPVEAATAAVVIYRLISFVLATIIGWIAWLALRDARRESAVTAGEG